VTVSTGARVASAEDVAALAALLATPRAVIVAGPTADADRVGESVLRLASRAGCPVLADPLSGARYRASCGSHRVAAYDLFVGDPEIASRLAPTAIVRVGASPTSAALQRFLHHHDGAPHVVVDGEGRWKDHGAVATSYVCADAATTLRAAAERAEPTATTEWRDAWRRAEEAALGALAELGALAGGSDEGAVLATVAGTLPSGATLFVSSSMPVRDLDAFAHPREEPLRVLGNRGASGIDGIVSTAFGVASQGGGPTVCVLGDVAFFHDQNGLLWSREPDAPVVFVLIDNDGGGIFHRLPIARHEPHFTKYFATPHGLDLRHAADLHGIGVRDAAPDELPSALGEALTAARTALVRVRTDRAANDARQRSAREAVVRVVRAALATR
jgi:2-succinyl-5-enolpyruvyl-6-hydroxy-3-cyclohexene-1-carboxylate synthase